MNEAFVMTVGAIEEEVIAFVADFSHYPIAKIAPHTKLVGGLGIDGDDGDEILTAFMQKFQVDIVPVARFILGWKASFRGLR